MTPHIIETAASPQYAVTQPEVPMWIPIFLVGSAIIHLLPAIGAFGRGPLERLYGVTLDAPDLVLMMRHRAVLFGILGGLLLAGAAMVDVRGVAILVVAAADLAFIALFLTTPDAGAPMRKVLWADLASLLMLGAAAAGAWLAS